MLVFEIASPIAHRCALKRAPYFFGFRWVYSARGRSRTWCWEAYHRPAQLEGGFWPYTWPASASTGGARAPGSAELAKATTGDACGTLGETSARAGGKNGVYVNNFVFVPRGG
ncbi:MAG: hypothetical protein ACLP4W_15005 [Mycobacterium sp.]|uniref:hypothetical protein n=1 Tax=Mycobacterium sp. TaxID=1785 RepID=UPI003F9BDD09